MLTPIFNIGKIFKTSSVTRSFTCFCLLSSKEKTTCNTSPNLHHLKRWRNHKSVSWSSGLDPRKSLMAVVPLPWITLIKKLCSRKLLSQFLKTCMECAMMSISQSLQTHTTWSDGLTWYPKIWWIDSIYSRPTPKWPLVRLKAWHSYQSHQRTSHQVRKPLAKIKLKSLRSLSTLGPTKLKMSSSKIQRTLLKKAIIQILWLSLSSGRTRVRTLILSVINWTQRESRKSSNS